MSIEHTQNYTISSDSGGATVTGVQAEVGATEITIDQRYGASLTNQLLAAAFSVANVQSVFLVSDKGLTLATNGVAAADVQTVSTTGSPAGGTFALGFEGQITAPLAFSASASDIQVALRALSTIGSGNVTCTGGALPGTPVVCTFAGTMATGRKSLIAFNSAGLTGGSTPTIVVTHTTPGLPSDTIILKPGTPVVWSKSAAYNTNPFTTDVTAFYVTTTASSRLQGKVLTV